MLGGLALTMSSVGLYAVVRYSVVERWHELGIRTALGASARQITSLILRESVFLIVGGLIVGVALALALVRLMTTILFGVIPTDVATFLGVVSLLTILAVLAAYFPARRAGRADPAFLLRSS